MKWKFWIDRGGTFTDVVAQSPSGQLISKKFLSVTDHYEDAVIFGIHQIMSEHDQGTDIAEIRMGTTVATNAFLERKGAKFAYVVTAGFADALWIGDQRRAELFQLGAVETRVLEDRCYEIDERVLSDGQVHLPLTEEEGERLLGLIFQHGYKNLAISLVNAFKNAKHEERLRDIAERVGFEFVITSSELSGQIGYLQRSNTTVVDSYVSPILFSYTHRIQQAFPQVPLLFMQSHGGLCPAEEFRGCRSLLSGPAGGAVGAEGISQTYEGFEQSLAFDMGGTSTDIALIDHGVSTVDRSEIANMEIAVPSVDLATIAAGGGSILQIRHGKMQVGPDSAGAKPGPVAYGLDGLLTVTDANVVLGRLSPATVPPVFGRDGQSDLSLELARVAFEQVIEQQGLGTSVEGLAQDFLNIAVENIAESIKKKALEKGLNCQSMGLVAFGGAAGQIATLVASKLKMNRVLIPHFGSVLSALGMGMADIVDRQARSVSIEFSTADFSAIERQLKEWGDGEYSIDLAQKGSEYSIEVGWNEPDQMKHTFQKSFQQQFGYNAPEDLVITALKKMNIARGDMVKSVDLKPVQNSSKPNDVYWKSQNLNQTIEGPNLVVDNLTSVFVDEGWTAEIKGNGDILLSLKGPVAKDEVRTDQVDPMYLEVFNRRFRSLAEQMGITLQRTSRSVNIRERLDFSCAIFNAQGEMIANAPHIPVHLGSMQEAVEVVGRREVRSGESYLLNSPYAGGTHLPDLTVVTPIFIKEHLSYWVASRGHHMDVGGSTPGSMPALSGRIEEEGSLIEATRIVENGELQVNLLRQLFSTGDHPSRAVEFNVADLQAQIAANHLGMRQLEELIDEFGQAAVDHYAEAILDYSDQQVQRELKGKRGHAERALDIEGVIDLKVHPHGTRWTFDFSDSSDQVSGNFNAPRAVVTAAVMYSLRCLIQEDIPLNSGCLRSIDIKTREGSLLQPESPAAVVAGNVETSQIIVDTVFAALGVSADSQGTMNNISFGTDQYQYYETLGGGQGASAKGCGQSAKQVHMTNSRLTDVEVLEQNFPVLLQSFSKRRGSGGHGEFNGGDGLIREIEFRDHMNLSIISGRRQWGPQGFSGGASGQAGINLLSDETLPSVISKPVQMGQTLKVFTPGGGGYRPTTKNRKLYFAYGSNLRPQQVLERTGAADMFGVGQLRDFKLDFTQWSDRWKGHVADIRPAEGQVVWGALFWFTAEQFKKMDIFEGGYQRVHLVAQDLWGRDLDVVTYEIIGEKQTDLPSFEYIQNIWSWARRHGFPKAYIDRLWDLREQSKLI